ncbi:FkbM family methyltransferase [Xanthobacter dioxanivorans]|uniref:FkbM family methyltransferase n=1 Tax=Xanthobacter dioxanivorans TaxID=2528964 RepID=A0A974PMC7_9HYPH|nr:FkbM family methyltransferase [Xanthobacter dioxanivorans]QRG05973.1 FkbM family methyltransferase [Xanthobacter dioxanivorans]
MNIVRAASRILMRFPNLNKALRDTREQMHLKSLKWGRVPGYNFKILGGGWLVAGVHGEDMHELRELEIVGKYLGTADYFIDIGANSGIFSCLSASYGIKCFAFEPMPANLKILLTNIRENNFNRLVEVFPLAVSSEVDILPIFNRGQGASLTRGWGGGDTTDCIFVPTNTLDGVLWSRVREKNVVLKIDVEGAEYSVLSGASNILSRKPPLLLELSLMRNHPNGFNPNFERVFQLLWSYGYSASIVDEKRTPVSEEMVSEWVNSRDIDIGTENFFFE